MVYSATLAQGKQGAVDSANYSALISQLTFVAIGALGMAIAFFTDYHRWLRPWPLSAILLLTLALLAAVLVFGVKVNGAQRWLRFAGFTCQPSEFAKIAVLLFMASSLALLRDRVRNLFTGYAPVMMVAGFFAGMVFLVTLSVEDLYPTFASR